MTTPPASALTDDSADARDAAPFSVCVYCGSRQGNNPAFANVAQQVGRWIGQRRGQLVYGGGKNGLMGMTARATQEAGGRVLGIIPVALVNLEVSNEDCDELLVVDTMHQRKALMAEHSQAFVTMPGGIGTFEELFEIWTWRQLGYHDKPVGILNVDGYYDKLLDFLQQCVDDGLMNDWQMSLLCVDTRPEPLLEKLASLAGSSHASAELLKRNL